jgi:hypothetical protein
MDDDEAEVDLSSCQRNVRLSHSGGELTIWLPSFSLLFSLFPLCSRALSFFFCLFFLLWPLLLCTVYLSV